MTEGDFEARGAPTTHAAADRFREELSRARIERWFAELHALGKHHHGRFDFSHSGPALRDRIAERTACAVRTPTPAPTPSRTPP